MKKPKRYSEENEQEDTNLNNLSEPVAVYESTDLNEIKIRVMEEVIKMDDPKMLEIVEDVIIELSLPKGERRPCQYTVEEMKEKLRKSQEDIKAGRVYTMEEVMKDWDTW